MQKEQQQLQQAHSSYDDVEPWHLPIGHRVEDSLDTDGIAMASTDTAIPDSNKGFQMLQKMGWKGTGLGRNENGELASPTCRIGSGQQLYVCHLASVVSTVLMLCSSLASSGVVAT